MVAKERPRLYVCGAAPGLATATTSAPPSSGAAPHLVSPNMALPTPFTWRGTWWRGSTSCRSCTAAAPCRRGSLPARRRPPLARAARCGWCAGSSTWGPEQAKCAATAYVRCVWYTRRVHVRAYQAAAARRDARSWRREAQRELLGIVGDDGVVERHARAAAAAATLRRCGRAIRVSAPVACAGNMGGRPAGSGVCSDRYRACRASRLQLPPSSATYMSWLPLIRV